MFCLVFLSRYTVHFFFSRYSEYFSFHDILRTFPFTILCVLLLSQHSVDFLSPYSAFLSFHDVLRTCACVYFPCIFLAMILCLFTPLDLRLKVLSYIAKSWLEYKQNNQKETQKKETEQIEKKKTQEKRCTCWGGRGGGGGK